MQLTTPAPYREVQTQLPAWYRGEVHAALHFGVLGGLTVALSVATVRVQPWLSLVVFALVPLWSVLEYWVHRSVLHGSWWSGLSRDHGTHHRYFPADDMFFANHLDVYRVLLRPQDVLAIELFIAAIGGATMLVDPGLGLALATSANLYVLLYELAHAASHFESVAAHPLLRSLSRHHRAHHYEITDARRNFAIVFPRVDHLFGTGPR